MRPSPSGLRETNNSPKGSIHHSSFVSGRVLDVVEVLDVLDFSAPLSSDSATANPSSSGKETA